MGATSGADFRDNCWTDWDRVSPTLESRELQQALESCEQVVAGLPDVSCDELRAIYLE